MLTISLQIHVDAAYIINHLVVAQTKILAVSRELQFSSRTCRAVSGPATRDPLFVWPAEQIPGNRERGKACLTSDGFHQNVQTIHSAYSEHLKF
jgi:hypothetical protein